MGGERGGLLTLWRGFFSFRMRKDRCRGERGGFLLLQIFMLQF